MDRERYIRPSPQTAQFSLSGGREGAQGRHASSAAFNAELSASLLSSSNAAIAPLPISAKPSSIAPCWARAAAINPLAWSRLDAVSAVISPCRSRSGLSRSVCTASKNDTIAGVGMEEGAALVLSRFMGQRYGPRRACRLTPCSPPGLVSSGARRASRHAIRALIRKTSP